MNMVQDKNTFLRLALCLGFFIVGCSNGPADFPSSNASDAARPVHVVNVLTEEVRPVVMRDMLVLPGQTEALHDIRLAAQRGGVVEWTGVTEGQRVRVGEPIARIDLSSLGAALERARASLRLAEDQLRRRSQLYAQGVLAKEELDQASNELTATRTRLREAEVDFSHGTVTSTLDGVINRLHVDPGEFVGEGDPVADIVNVETLRINFDVPEGDVRFLAQGQKVVVRVDAYPEREWAGEIDFVAWKADPATRTFQVRVVVDNEGGAIRPGMIARGAFLRRLIEGAVTAPLFTVQDKGGERVVFVEQDGVARARTVQLGIIEGDRVQVLDGLAAGDRLIVAGHAEVEDGTRVNVR
ncbi:MAG: efflux RND transporter periplasmic adaptor subunit [Desulfomicrobium sp.]|nr:efflux RND transporter periplasmic adaptor subunit [Desulfomicrobium sp.]